MTITGIDHNDEKFEKLQKERWKRVHFNSQVFHCKVHDAYFEPAKESCWQCYNECTKEVITNDTK